MPPPLLQLKNVSMTYRSGLFDSGSSFTALDTFSLDIHENPARITAIAGESGSGKTTLANLILGFLSPTDGRILYRGVDIARMDRPGRLAYRREVQAIFQDPYDVFNPFYRVRHTFNLVMKRFGLTKSRDPATARIEEALNVVGLRGEEILEKYPHQLSGGQRQRLMIARAFMLHPRLIVADEPVSAVDASLRAMILDIMTRLRDEHGIAFLYITHDLSTAYQISDDMVVLFRGITAERGPAGAIIQTPRHPYVQELIGSIPVPDPSVRWDMAISLPSEEKMREETGGCRFYMRCPLRMDRCRETQPPLRSVDEDRAVACYLYEQTFRENP